VPPSPRPLRREGSSNIPLYQSVQGARSEIESEPEESGQEQASAPAREAQRSPSLADMLAMSPPRSRSESQPESRPADTRAHLERLKQQMDVKAGIAPAPKKSGGLSSKLFGQRKRKPQPSTPPLQADPGRNTSPAAPKPEPKPTARRGG